MASKEGESSVNTLTGTQCNIIEVNNQEQDPDLDFDNSLANMEGGGGVNTPTGTECNSVYQTDEEEFNPTNEPTIYETDEEEFSETRSTELVTDHKVSVTAHIPATGAPKCRKTAKRKVILISTTAWPT